MTEVERISDQLQRAHEGGAFHGPALREVLAGVTAAQAAARPLPQAHTIWEIVLHIAAWEAIFRRRLSGEVIGEVSAAQDWPPVTDTSGAAWEKTLEELERGQQQLRQVISSLSASRLDATVPVEGYSVYSALDATVPVKGYSVYFMLHGIIQHALYHAGQIALLKKALV